MMNTSNLYMGIKKLLVTKTPSQHTLYEFDDYDFIGGKVVLLVEPKLLGVFYFDEVSDEVLRKDLFSYDPYSRSYYKQNSKNDSEIEVHELYIHDKKLIIELSTRGDEKEVYLDYSICVFRQKMVGVLNGA